MKNNKNNKGNLIAIIIIVVAVLFIWLLSSSNTSNTNTASNKSKTEFDVGETIQCGDFDITLQSYNIKYEGESIDSYLVISDPEWIGIIVEVTNTSNSKSTFNDNYLKLVNTSGEIIDHSVLTYKLWGYEPLNNPELIAGGKKTGYIQYANTETDNSDIKIQAKCGIGGTTYTYNLK